MLIRKIVQKNGGSWGVSFPAELVRELGWKKHTYVYVQKARGGSLMLRAVPDVAAATIAADAATDADDAHPVSDA